MRSGHELLGDMLTCRAELNSQTKVANFVRLVPPLTQVYAISLMQEGN